MAIKVFTDDSKYYFDGTKVYLNGFLLEFCIYAGTILDENFSKDKFKGARLTKDNHIKDLEKEMSIGRRMIFMNKVFEMLYWKEDQYGILIKQKKYNKNKGIYLAYRLISEPITSFFSVKEVS